MKKQSNIVRASLFPLSALLLFFAAASISAGEVEERIKALEAVQRVNAEELERLKSEQLELKKEATAAAAALPEFVYRPGRGLTITAADGSWGLGFDHEFNMDMTWLEGQDARRNGDFELFGRRNRPSIYFYRDRGFYEFTFRLDCDSGDCANVQRSALYMHFENLNRWFPTVQFGIDTPSTGNSYDRGSSSTAPTLEHSLLRRDAGWGGGGVGAHTGISFIWQNLPTGVSPGTWAFHYYWAINSLARADGLTDQSSKMDHAVYFDLKPFEQSKNKWINGFAFNIGAAFTNIDERNTTNASRRLRLRNGFGPNNVTMFDTGTDMGPGLNVHVTPGIRYRIGPYTLLASGYFFRQNAERNALRVAGGEVGRIEGNNFKLVNELFLWSPKGFLTGSVATPNSVLVAASFERNDVTCGRPNCDETNGAPQHFGRNSVLVREFDLVYYLRPGINMALAFRWYDAANMPTSQQVAVGCSRNNALRAGKSCDWVDSVLRFRYYF